jgi:hypothetical protein
MISKLFKWGSFTGLIGIVSAFVSIKYFGWSFFFQQILSWVMGGTIIGITMMGFIDKLDKRIKE